MIEASASERHYLEHIAPIARALDCTVWCDSVELTRYASDDLDLFHARSGIPLRPSSTPLLVASWRDATRAAATRPLILLEHGAGQTYQGINPPSPNYAGGPGWEQARLILSPGPHSARHWRNAYPTTPVVELRGSPRLDSYARCPANCDRGTARSSWTAWGGQRCNTCGGTGLRVPMGPSQRKTAPIGVSFHWDCTICPETADTAQEWLEAVQRLAQQQAVLATAHPKAWGWLRHEFYARDIAATPRFTDLLDACWLYVCDNSSTMFEWAALGRPVLALDGRRYRRTVQHGLRFWDACPGLHVSPGDDLAAMTSWYVDQAYSGLKGQHAAEVAYGGLWDGRSLERALAALKALGLTAEGEA